jgi:hypothetical protein
MPDCASTPIYRRSPSAGNERDDAGEAIEVRLALDVRSTRTTTSSPAGAPLWHATSGTRRGRGRPLSVTGTKSPALGHLVPNRRGSRHVPSAQLS